MEWVILIKIVSEVCLEFYFRSDWVFTFGRGFRVYFIKRGRSSLGSGLVSSLEYFGCRIILLNELSVILVLGKGSFSVRSRSVLLSGIAIVLI